MAGTPSPQGNPLHTIQPAHPGARDLADHFLDCAKLGRYLTVPNNTRFVITDDFRGDRRGLRVPAAFASVYSRDPLVAQSALLPLGRRASKLKGRERTAFEELFQLIEDQALNPRVKNDAEHLMRQGFATTRIAELERELGAKLTPARLRYRTFLEIIRAMTEGRISTDGFRDEFLSFTGAVAGKLDFGIYSFAVERIFKSPRIAEAAKRLLADELLKFPPLIRRELITNILANPATTTELAGYIRSQVHSQLDMQLSTEIQLLEAIKARRLAVAEIERSLAAAVAGR